MVDVTIFDTNQNEPLDELIKAEQCRADRQSGVDIASAALAVLMFFIVDEYMDKYEDVKDWRDALGIKIKDHLETDIDHYINVVMVQMNNAISDIENTPTVVVDYEKTRDDYEFYSFASSLNAENTNYMITRKGCDFCFDCGDNVRGWGVVHAISAADKRIRFDEARVARRLDLIASSLNTAHRGTFNLPAWDYQAFGQAVNISGSLASMYAGTVNSALGSFGYYANNFVTSLG